MVVAPGPGSTRPAAEDFALTLGGHSVDVLSVAALAPEPGGLPWQVLIYFDTPLSTPDGLAAAIGTLRHSAERLIALGPVSIVAADPEPRELLSDGRHAHEVRETLDLFEDRTTLAGELVWRRLRYLDAGREAGDAESRALMAMEQEARLLDRQRQALAQRLAHRPAAGPGLLILVQDGFDLDFKRFYLSRTDRLESLDSDLDEAHAALCRAASAAGWTVVSLALGKQGSELNDPHRPLQDLATATAGTTVLESDDLEHTLASLEGRMWLSYSAPAVREPVELSVLLRDRRVSSARWAGAVESPVTALSSSGETVAADEVIRLLPPSLRERAGDARVTAVTGGHEIGYVAFFVDGFLVDVARRAPYQTRVNLGAEPRTVRAVAFSPDALELGEDSLRLNEQDRPFRVDIVDVRGEPSFGEVELDADVATPAGRVLERVDFFWNTELRDSFEAPIASERLTGRLETSRPRASDHYRVIAHLDDGSSLETARMAIGGDASDRLDVNLVEIYATVVDRRDGPLADLTRDDFTLVHRGRPHPVSGFARAQELPLTLGLAVDTSQSMAGWQDDMRQAAAIFFESALGAKDRAFLTDFDTRPRLTQPPTGRQELLVGRMGGLDFGGYTALYDAVLFSLMQFEELGGRKALVVLSDGDDYGSRFRPERCIREARRLGVPIYMVVREDPGRPLETVERMVAARLASETGGQAHFFSSRDRLDEIYGAIEADLRSQYLLTYETARPLTAADLGDIRVEVRDPKLSVRTILGSSVQIR